MATSGETHLPTLLHTMTPTLDPETYIYATLPSKTTPQSLPTSLDIRLLFRESESWTLITTKASAHDHISSSSTSLSLSGVDSFECRMITLAIHSSLEAVGFIAAVSAALAGEKVPCNVVAGFLHDHVFVPVAKVDQAMGVLERLASGDKA